MLLLVPMDRLEGSARSDHQLSTVPLTSRIPFSGLSSDISDPVLLSFYFGLVAQMVDSVTNPRSSISSMLATRRAMSEGWSLLGLSGLADVGDD